ncbi:FHA domain-containing protein [Massilia sp. SR12]
MNKCCNPDHPHCTYWVMPGESTCSGGHAQSAPEQEGGSFAVLSAMRHARSGPQAPAVASSYTAPARVHAQLHISGFDPRAAGGRQSLKMELRGMPQDCAPQLSVHLRSELIPHGGLKQQFIRSVHGDWRPVFVEFSSRGKEHGQYQIHAEILSKGEQTQRQWECTFVILVPRVDASLNEIHRTFLSTHKNVRVMADDAAIARVTAQGGNTMDIDVTARNAGIAHLDLGAAPGKVDVGYSTIAWDEDLIEIAQARSGPTHPHPTLAASFINAEPEGGACRHIRMFAMDEVCFGRFELVDPEADALLHHFSAEGPDADGLTRRLSGRHALIRHGKHGFEIEDVSRYGLLLDGVWPGKNKPAPLRAGMKIEMSASIKGIALLEVSAVMPHGVILHRIDQGARAECFVLLARDTHPGYPLPRHHALPAAATLPLLMHHEGGFWHIDQLTGKETALAPTPKQEKLSRIPAHTRFASDAYPEHWIIRTGATAHSTVAAHATA